MSAISESHINSTAAESTGALGWIGNYLNRQAAVWLDYLVTPTPLFPKDFIEEIEKSNEGKPNAPLALIIYGADDFNDALYSRASLSVIKQIAKTHKVALTTIQSHHLIGDRIKKISEEHDQTIELLYLAGHGTKNSSRFGGNGYLSISPKLTTENLPLHADDFSLLSKNTPIILYSCNAGKAVFAKKLAQIAQRCVLAPTETLSAGTTVFRHLPGQPPEILSYNQEHNQIMQKHYPDGRTELADTQENALEMQELLQEKLQYMIETAEAGEAKTQFHLGLMYRDGIGVEESMENALAWLERAAEQGFWKAQAALSQLHEFQTGNFVEALRWYRCLALQGCEGADKKIETLEMYIKENAPTKPPQAEI